MIDLQTACADFQSAAAHMSDIQMMCWTAVAVAFFAFFAYMTKK